jgi:hypothetical protein
MVLQPNDTASRILVVLTFFTRTGREHGFSDPAKIRLEASERDNAAEPERNVRLEMSMLWIIVELAQVRPKV